MAYRSIKYEYLYPLIIVILSFLSVTFFLSWQSRLPISVAWALIVRDIFPSPDVNGFYFKGHISYLLIYFGIIMALTYSVILEAAFKKVLKKHIQGRGARYKTNPIRIMFIMLIIMTFIQHISQFHNVMWKHYLFSGKTQEQKKMFLFGFLFQFAQNCKESLSGYHSARLVTDMDLSHVKDMTRHRYLAYHLFPINIRSYDEKARPDCLVYFSRWDAISQIPEGYVIRYQFDRDNLLAVREDLL